MMAIKALLVLLADLALAARAVGGPGRTGPGIIPPAAPDAQARPLVITYRAGLDNA